MKKIVSSILLLSFVIVLVGFGGCEKVPVENTYGLVQKGGEPERTDWAIGLKLKSTFAHDYLLLDTPIIKDLLLKYATNGINFYSSCPGAVNKELLRCYTLRASDNEEVIIEDFLATGLFENEYHVYGIAVICMSNNGTSVTNGQNNIHANYYLMANSFAWGG